MAKSGQKNVKEAIRSRIVGHSEENPEDLMANPLNFRRHPGSQLEALRGSMKELGWIKSVLVNKVTGHVIDGHARCEEAMRQGVKVPVDWVELSPEEERLALAVLDPITEMATRDENVLAQLLADVQTEDEGLAALLDSMRKEETESPTITDTSSQLGALEFRIVIDCQDEHQQGELLARFEEEGLKCRALMS